jgi:nucleotide-binding universal stress UspA family protein
MLSIRTVLFPTDFSDRSMAAFDLACSLARDYSAELVVAHVASPPVQGVSEGMVVELPTGWEDAVRTRLAAVRTDDPRVRLTHRFEVGDPADEIVRLAGEVKADLLVMGSHGRTGLRRLLAGSVAEEVMRKAPCPVLTVRLPFPVPLTGTPAASAAVPTSA